MVIWTYR